MERTNTKQEEEIMLALSRKEGETIVISLGEMRVNVTVIRFTAHQVVLGFEAPKAIRINRLEVQNKIDQKEAKP